MAKGSIMLQLEVLQRFFHVTTAPSIDAVAIDFLDGGTGTTTVREIATQKTGFFYVGNGRRRQVLQLSTSSAFTELSLRSPGELTSLQAPSHVPSPPFKGAQIVLLRVRDFGFDAGDQEFDLERHVGAHAYLDEV
jgi:hypothetical protein